MSKYLIYRLLYAVLVVWGSLTLVFLIVRVVPGDPAAMYAGPLASPDQVAAARTTLGLDHSLVQQYFSFLGNAVTLDFGRSYRLGEPVAQLVVERIPATAQLAATAMALGVLLSFPLGILSARFRGRAIDRLLSLVSLLGQAVPNFWLGIVMILVFSVTLHWLPTGGMGTPAQLIMPSLVLAAPLIGLLTRLVRAGLIEVMEEPYILTARSKGLGYRVILFRHAMKNMLIPVITVMGIQLGQLLSGAVIVETVFAWPGLGRLLVEAITNRDFPIVQGVILFIAVVVVLLNLIVDLLYGVLDPRVRLEGAA